MQRKNINKLIIVFVVCIAAITFLAYEYNEYKELNPTPIKNESTGKWGYINEKGEMLTPYKYDLAEKFRYRSDGLARVYIGSLPKDTAQTEATWKLYEEKWGLYKDRWGLVGYQGEGKWGLIDKKGKEVVPCKYNYISDFRGETGLAAGRVASVNVGGKYGFVREYNVYNYRVAPRQFVRERDSYKLLGGKWGFIDKKGREAIPVKSEYPILLYEGKGTLWIAENGVTKAGDIDSKGNFTSPPIPYSDVRYTGTKSVEDGQTLAITFTLATVGEKRTIFRNIASIGKGDMTSFHQEPFYPSGTKVEKDGSFSSDSLSGTILSDKIHCVVTIKNGSSEKRYKLSAYPDPAGITFD